MIVPQNRLLFWVAVIVLPFAALGALLPEGLLLTVVLIVALALLALVDAMLAFSALDGITVSLPAVARFSKDREGALEVTVRNERQRALRLRLGIPFPRAIVSLVTDLQVALPAGSEWSRLEWRCTPCRRGNFTLARTCLEAASPLGFWALRGSVPVAAELRVYPNLLAERKNLAALLLNRGAAGIHAQRQVGKGREFEKLREYIPGDSFDEIHWKATARRGRPITKVYQLERTQEVYVVIDASRLSARRSAAGSGRGASPARATPGADRGEGANPEAGVTVLERFITAALTLGLAAEQQGDLFGLVTFASRVERFVRAKNGKAHHSQCRDALYTLEPQLLTPDFDEVATFIRLQLRRRALVLFLTALDDPVLAESFVRNLDLLCRQHLVLVNMLRPDGAAPLFSQPDLASVDDLYRALGGHHRWHRLRELEKVLQRRGVPFCLLEDERLTAQLVSQYLSVKQRQIL
jgi:uncharacterized protein (DUF58 family)